PERVVHLAALAGVRPSLERPAEYMDVNVRGTAVLLEAARKSGVGRFVFGSSSSVYGSTAVPPFKESARIDSPLSPYAASKALGARAELDLQPEQKGDMRLTSADVSHAAAVLGYAPSTPMRQGLAKFAAWVRGEGRDWV